MEYYLAVDIGASSGRHILGWIQNGKLCIEEVYRFENNFTSTSSGLVWDVEQLFLHIVEGLKRCASLGKVPKSMGIDTWGVDYALLDNNDNLIGKVFCYRDSRTASVIDEVHKIVSKSELYAKCGVQSQAFNTIYQLYADKLSGKLSKAKSFLMMPDYLGFLLTGCKVNEYTNATTTALVGTDTNQWNTEVIGRLGLPLHLFKPLSAPGTTVGRLLPEICKQVGFCTDVVLPCTHDTASAVVAVPSTSPNTLYISSGTWSLLGVELDSAITTSASQLLNYTNEGGYNYKFRYLKNIVGLWIIQCIRRELGGSHSFAQLVQLAQESASFSSVFNANDSRFISPANMTEEINSYLTETSQPLPSSVGELAFCVYNSLAIAYSNAVKELEAQTGVVYRQINVVGGGCKNLFLCQLTAKHCNKAVVVEPSEATAVGNIAVQMIAGNQLNGIDEAREIIKTSFPVRQI